MLKKIYNLSRVKAAQLGDGMWQMDTNRPDYLTNLIFMVFNTYLVAPRGF